MTLALRYAVRSDVGLLREGNEDSAYAGPHLLAVADGMGGHAAGEVASAATITTIAALDTEHVGQDLAGAVAGAVASANLRLQELIHADPATEGMGTTLTAILWVDGHAALGHIGDSRAYLLRNGQFYQISHDHSLVQSLIDEGKITEEDAAVHPHRSLLLRALDGRTVAEPDVTVHETMAGDRYLLCSDGLSGVVSEQTLHETLRAIWDPDKAALQLIELAIKGGGPDNITCIVADVIDSAEGNARPTRTPSFAGAAVNGPPGQPVADTNPGFGPGATPAIGYGASDPQRPSSPATRARNLTRTMPQPAVPDEDGADWSNNGYGESQGGPGSGPGGGSYDGDDSFGGHEPSVRHKRRWPIVTSLLVIVVLILVGGGIFGWRYVQSQYYVAEQNGHVVLFRGVNQSLAGLSLSSPVQTYTDLQVSQLDPASQSVISRSQSFASQATANQAISQMQQKVTQCHGEYTALAAWQVKETAYSKALVAYNNEVKAHAKNPKKPAAPPAEPAVPTSGECAPSTAFNIPASALPAQGGQPGGESPAPSTSVSPKAPASASASPRSSA